MTAILDKIRRFDALSGSIARIAQAPFLLGIRVYVSWVFFKAGLTKIDDWGATLFLFEYEYQVPLLDHVFAAWLATAGELILPVLLAIGLFSRIAASGLFIVNAVAVISLAVVPPAALNQHILWGLALTVAALWGGGKLSLDNVIRNISIGKGQLVTPSTSTA